MKFMKKFLASILTVALFATLIMTTAFADDKYEVIELPYASGVHGCFNDGYAAIIIDGKFTYIDENGNIPSWCSNQYLTTFQFSEGLAAVMNEDFKVGYIDTNGNLVIDFIFDYHTFQGIYSVGKFVDGKSIAYKQIKESNGYFPQGNNIDYIECFYIDKNGNNLGTVGENDDTSKYNCLDIGVCTNEDYRTVELFGNTYDYVHFENGIALLDDLDTNKMYILKEKDSAGKSEGESIEEAENIEPSVWAKEEIDKAENYGITANLYSNYNIDNNYYQKNITREEFASLIVGCIERLEIGLFAPLEEDEEYIEFDENTPLKDIYGVEFVDTDNEDVYIAYEMGIVNGVGDDMFAPKQNITRQEIAVMMHRAIKYAEQEKGLKYVNDNTTLQGFSDFSSIADWAVDSVGILANNGIMKGTGETTLSPLNNASREQAIILAVRIYELLN
jgi:hypothetical protein